MDLGSGARARLYDLERTLGSQKTVQKRKRLKAGFVAPMFHFAQLTR